MTTWMAEHWYVVLGLTIVAILSVGAYEAADRGDMESYSSTPGLAATIVFIGGVIVLAALIWAVRVLAA